MQANRVRAAMRVVIGRPTLNAAIACIECAVREREGRVLYALTTNAGVFMIFILSVKGSNDNIHSQALQR